MGDGRVGSVGSENRERQMTAAAAAAVVGWNILLCLRRPSVWSFGSPRFYLNLKNGMSSRRDIIARVSEMHVAYHKTSVV